MGPEDKAVPYSWCYSRKGSLMYRCQINTLHPSMGHTGTRKPSSSNKTSRAGYHLSHHLVPEMLIKPKSFKTELWSFLLKLLKLQQPNTPGRPSPGFEFRMQELQNENHQTIQPTSVTEANKKTINFSLTVSFIGVQ